MGPFGGSGTNTHTHIWTFFLCLEILSDLIIGGDKVEDGGEGLEVIK